MTALRLAMHQLQEMIRLHRLGQSDRSVARALHVGRNTLQRYFHALHQAGLLEGPAEPLPELKELKAVVAAGLRAAPLPQQSSTAEPWRPRIEALLRKGAGPQAIHDRLRLEDPDFSASLSAVKRLCLRLRQECGIRPEDVAIRVETEPGEVAQVDFGYAGKLYDPERGVFRKAWIFVLVLGHSRHMWAELVFDQKIETWLRLHVDAFQALGAVPRLLVPDNLKTAVVRAAFGLDEQPTLQRSYVELARHYGFRVEPTPPHQPQKKGKVESGVKYAKNNFLKTLETRDVQHARLELRRWLHEIAGRRIHGTTGKRPAEVFEKVEQPAMLPLPARPFQLVVWKAAKVHRDSHIQIDRAFYSVPWRFLHQTVWARCTANSVTIYHQEERLHAHGRVPRGKRSTVPEHLPDHRGDLRERSRSFWEERAGRLGTEVLDYVRFVFDSDDVLSKLRTVQGAVKLLEDHPKTRARAACRRALYFGNPSYGALKRILREGLDLLPPPFPTPRRWMSAPRYSRNPEELLRSVRIPNGNHR